MLSAEFTIKESGFVCLASLGVSEMHVNANTSYEFGEKNVDGHSPGRECSSNFFQLVPQLLPTFNPCVFNFVYFYFHF